MTTRTHYERAGWTVHEQNGVWYVTAPDRCVFIECASLNDGKAMISAALADIEAA
mgnify:CR=1 FL=1